jgi:hypothetical protein
MSDMRLTPDNMAAKFAAKGLSEALEIYNAGHTFKFPDRKIGEIVGWCVFEGRITSKQRGLLHRLLEQSRTNQRNELAVTA